ncbi:MAG: hypothetical protein ACK4TA_09455 [Saprospiraceae bacterium]
MSAIEAKKEEIYQILDRVPERVIDEVLDYLHKIDDNKTTKELSFVEALQIVMTEDDELLKRLAQ